MRCARFLPPPSTLYSRCNRAAHLPNGKLGSVVACSPLVCIENCPKPEEDVSQPRNHHSIGIRRPLSPIQWK